MITVREPIRLRAVAEMDIHHPSIESRYNFAIFQQAEPI